MKQAMRYHLEKGSVGDQSGQEVGRRGGKEPKYSGVMERVVTPTPKRNINVVHCNIVNPEDGSILVIKRSLNEDANPGLWEKPSGKIETDMEGHDAIARNVNKECDEELGLIVDPSEVYASPRDNELLVLNDHPRYDQIMIHPAYVVYVPRTRIVLRETGHCDWRFVDQNTYSQLAYVSGVKESLDKYFQQRKGEGVSFPHELAQVIRCIIVDEHKQRLLMRKRLVGQSFSFPSIDMKSGVTPYTSAQHLLYDLGFQGEFNIAPLTSLHFPAHNGDSQELHHYFLVSPNEKLPDMLEGTDLHRWFDAKQGCDALCTKLEAGKNRPSIRKVLEKLFRPSLSDGLSTISKDSVTKRPLRTRSHSMI